jgi:hypothetical protein
MSDTQQSIASNRSKAEKVFWGIGILIVAIGVLGTSLLTTLAGLSILPITGKLLRDKLKVTKPALVQFTALMIILLIGMFTLDTATPAETPTPTPTQQTVVAAFDIPSLVGKSLSEIETALGAPTKYTPPPQTYVENSSIRTWEKTWNKDGYSLMVTYDLDTLAITDLFLGTDTDAAFATFNKKENILATGNLSATSNEYSLEFVEVINKPEQGYTGVIIRSK